MAFIQEIGCFLSNTVGFPADVVFLDCEEEERSLPRIEGKYLVSKLSIDCGETIKGKEISLKGLSRITDALISLAFLDGTKFESLATVNNPRILVPEEVSIYPTTFLVGSRALVKWNRSYAICFWTSFYRFWNIKSN